MIGIAIDVVALKEESFLAEWYPDPKDQFLLLTVITAIIWILESLFNIFMMFYGGIWVQTAQHDLRMDAYSHIQNLEMQWFSEQTTGGLMAIMNDDVNQLERFLDQVLMTCFK